MKRRLFALTLAFLLVVSAAPRALAAGTASLAAKGTRGDGTITVTVSLQGGAGATNGRVKVSYNPSLVTLSECQEGDGNWAFTSLDEGWRLVTDENGTPIDASGEPILDGDVSRYVYEELGTVAFAWVGSDLPAGTTVLTLVFADASDNLGGVGFTAVCTELYGAGANGPEAMTVTPSEVQVTVDCSEVEAPGDSGIIPPSGGTEEPGETEEPETPFVDIEEHWAEEAIIKIYEAGLVAGTGDGTTYEPDTDLTRSMFVTILHRANGTPSGAPEAQFSDIEAESWYSEALNWAADRGVTTGTGDGTTFSPNDIISRQQLMAMLYRYAQLEGRDVSNRASLEGYADAGEVSDWAAEAMSWAVAEGIIQGNGAMALVPNGNATRAQMATILVRYLGL